MGNPDGLSAALLVRMQRLFVPVFVRVVQRGFFGVLLGVGREAVGCVAVVGGLFVITPLLKVFGGSAVVFHGVLEVMSSLLVSFDDFLVLFGVVLLGRHNAGRKVKK